MSKTPMVPIFVTVPGSHYVEKARWALQLARVPFVEEKHAPVFSRFSTVPKGGKTVPLLYFPDTKTALTESSAIVAYCAKTEPWLYANETAKELELFFDTSLAPDTRRLRYAFMFQDVPRMKQAMIASTGGWFERLMLRIFFPILKAVIARALNVTDESVYNSMDKVEEVVAKVDSILGDAPFGTRYLAGDAFSAADIAFCAHMTLIVGPPEHQQLSPVKEYVQDHPLRARLEKIQQSRTVAFVLWCYSNKRLAPTVSAQYNGHHCHN